MAAFAPNAIILFLARALDGLTAGNVPVASAVISDTTSLENRAKGFGIIGASFGFGFVFGPLIATLTVGISPSLPFIIAGIIATISTLITALYLKETNQHLGEVMHGKLFDFAKLYHTLFDPNVGVTFLITFFYWIAFSLFIYGFQPFSVKALHLSAQQISGIFVAFGVIGLISQLVLVQNISKWLGLKRGYSLSILLVAVAFLAMFFTRSYEVFIVVAVFLGLANSIVNPLTQTILSQETDAKSQGSVMGLNTSYMSLGQIFGPILGGVLATLSLAYPFLAGSLFTLFCFGLSFLVMRSGVAKEHAF
jgi:predicted MFS family arabinose efflux permease